MNLFYQKLGNGPALFILHGLYGSSDNWMTFARAISEEYTVFLIDLRNHGRSPHYQKHDYFSMSADIKEIVEKENLKKISILGHSMGGKTAMLYAMSFPDDISKMIIVDIAPVNYSSVDRFNSQVITHLNIVHSLLSVDMPNMKSRMGIDAELDKSIKDISVKQFLMKNVHRNHDGSFQWKFNLDAISKSLPDIMGFVSVEKLPLNTDKMKFPVLFIRGENSEYILPEYYAVIGSIFPGARVETIINAGHWVHAEQPAKFLELVKSFLGSNN